MLTRSFLTAVLDRIDALGVEVNPHVDSLPSLGTHVCKVARRHPDITVHGDQHCKPVMLEVAAALGAPSLHQAKFGSSAELVEALRVVARRLP